MKAKRQEGTEAEEKEKGEIGQESTIDRRVSEREPIPRRKKTCGVCSFYSALGNDDFSRTKVIDKE